MTFFTNSGTEAVECALKTARRYHSACGQPERIDVIGFEGSFHGRSYAAVNASGNASYLEGFGPRLPGYVQLPFGDLEALKAAIGPTTAAIIIEPVQGEGGARSLSAVQLAPLRALCDETGVLLIYDEIQCGLGRTGRLFAYEWADNAAPDIMCVAKALGGGFPVGACLATAEAAKGMTVGAHGSTYGGNPLAMAVGLAAVDELTKPELLAHVREVAGYFGQQLARLADRYPGVIAEEVRGQGLLIGLKLIPNNREFMALARDEKLLIAGGGDNCVRLLPPLIISQDEAREAVEELERVCQTVRKHSAAASTNMLSLFRPSPPGGLGRNLQMTTQPRHFIDLWDIEPAALRAILDDAKARKAARIPAGPGRADADAPARDPHPGDDFPEELDPHLVFLRRGDAPARRRPRSPRRPPTCSSAAARTIEDTARVLSSMVDAIMIRADKHSDIQGHGGSRQRAGDQRPHRLQPPVPGHGRRDDLRGASRRPGRHDHRLGGRWQQCLLQLHPGGGGQTRLPETTYRPARWSMPPAAPTSPAPAELQGQIEVTRDPKAAVEVAAVWWSPTPGFPWATRTATRACSRSSPIGSTLGPDVAGGVQRYFHALPAGPPRPGSPSEVIDGPQLVILDEDGDRVHAQKSILAWCLGAIWIAPFRKSTGFLSKPRRA